MSGKWFSFHPWIISVDEIALLKAANISLPAAPSHSPFLNDGHHGLAKHNLSNTDLDMTGLGAVLTKRHLNSICPISKLPPELLSSVFSINVLCDRPGTKDGTYSLGWISVTQVCHQWREVALATKSLWRFLDFAYMSRKWCSEMLRRSGNCLLEIAMRVTGFSGPYPAVSSFDLARELLGPEYSPRLVGLQLDLSSLARNSVESLIQSLQQSAPLLESLELRQTSWEPMTIGSLASCLPSFKRLALHNVFLSPWVSPIFVNLHELHISFDRHRLLDSQDTLPSYGEVATIIGHMPELRILELRNVFSEGADADSEGLSGHTISLPNLQKLTLIDQQECDLLSFASLLCMPSTTCAEIKTNGRLGESFSSAVSLFSHYDRTFGPVRRLKLLANGRRQQVTVEFRASEALSVESDAPSQLRLDYTLPLLPSPLRDAADIKSPTPFPTSRIITLHLGDSARYLGGLLYLEIVSHAPTTTAAAATTAVPQSSDCWWAALFSHATRVQQICATYRGAVDGLIEALQVRHQHQHQHPHESEPWPQPLLLFPDLRAVKLSLIDLDEEVEVAADVPPLRTARRGDALLDCLMRRRELMGVGIRELEVSDRDERWVRRLLEIVPRVVHAEI